MLKEFAALAGTVLLAGAALAAAPSASAQPASAGPVKPLSMSATAYGTSSICTWSSMGRFAFDGDIYTITDECKDGWSGVLEVDEEPLQLGNSYDFIIYANGGVGTTETLVHNIKEGTKVFIRAGVGHPSTGEVKDFGNWVEGIA